ncbi:ribonuclease p protein subunit p25 [Limosa lapponica baueri]|uniref:Cytochrome c oxidase subunit 5A, mitochondrial n=1 Tax=Limosa lapponica baueri TaxID=1758121 RepID=A0A2I0TAI5_LIMLA|nr:ribonuclease p protein subunit p25 [Limosa lapponica baueri]
MAAEGGGAKPVAQSRMENFRKVRTSEEESPLPFPDLPPDVVEMKVKEGSKIRNLMNFAMAQMELKGRRQIVFSGCGRAVTKTITCVEIMKRKLGGLHQVTKVRYKTLLEVWENQDPLPGGPAQNLTVHKNVPSICILLSRDPLDPNQTGYQPPEPRHGPQLSDAGEDTSALPFFSPSAVLPARCYSHGSQESDEEFDARWVTYFNKPDIDAWELRKGINTLVGYDLVPEPKIIDAALRACRRLNDFASAVRILEVVKARHWRAGPTLPGCTLSPGRHRS